MEALDLAIEKAGSAMALAKSVGVSSNAPSMWKTRGRVPAEHCPSIEAATGVRCEELRPDVNWAVLRGTAGDVATPTQEAANA